VSASASDACENELSASTAIAEAKESTVEGLDSVKDMRADMQVSIPAARKNAFVAPGNSRRGDMHATAPWNRAGPPLDTKSARAGMMVVERAAMAARTRGAMVAASGEIGSSLDSRRASRGEGARRLWVTAGVSLAHSGSQAVEAELSMG